MLDQCHNLEAKVPALIRSVPAGLGARDVIEEVTALLQKLEGEQRVSDPFGNRIELMEPDAGPG